MLKVYCLNCEESIVIENENKMECPKCFGNNFDNIEKVKQNEQLLKEGLEIIGLELIYQKTFQKIIVPKSKVILGRENLGNEIFCEIRVNDSPVISRSHCSIEFDVVTNMFMIEDLGSLNGTFINDKKCIGKVIVENNTLIKLGRELFTSKYLYAEDKVSNKDTINEKEIELSYYCSQCSKVFEEDGYCPDCDVKLKKT